MEELTLADVQRSEKINQRRFALEKGKILTVDMPVIVSFCHILLEL